MDLVIGDRALAEKLGVTERTVRNWNRIGLLNDARYRRGVRGNAYDMRAVIKILKY